jgi:hypothetical protein
VEEGKFMTDRVGEDFGRANYLRHQARASSSRLDRPVCRRSVPIDTTAWRTSNNYQRNGPLTKIRC